MARGTFLDWSGVDAGTSLLPSVPGAGAAAPGMSFGQMMSYAGPVMGIFGAISGGLGSYFSAQSQSDNLKFQSDMAAINARMAENTAQSILDAGNKQIGQTTLKYGQMKGTNRVNTAARGIQGGVGSAAEVEASIDYAKEADAMTINANAVRQAWAARSQATNAMNESLLKGTSAGSISPFSAMSTSLIGSASNLAPQWYNLMKGGR